MNQIRERRTRSILLAVFLVFLVCAAMIVTVQAYAVNSALLWLNPVEASVPEGGSAQVVIQLDNVSNVYGAQVSLSFDPSVLSVVDADPGVAGTQLTPGSCPQPNFVVTNTADNTTGTIDYAVTQLSPTPPCNGGSMATIEFQCLVTGVEFNVVFTDSLISDPDLNAIPHANQNGTVACLPLVEAGITVEPTSGLETTEAGGTDAFTVVLDSQPSANVSIGLSSNDTSEGTVSPTSLTFTPANWDSAQTVTVTGVDDTEADGNQAYTIITAPASSSDPDYDGFNPANVSVTNNDDDNFGISVTPTSGLETTEAGGTDTFTVVLDSQPSANVSIGLSSSDTSEGTVSPTSLTFTTANWDSAQTVTVTGVDDAFLDGDIPYNILTAPATSADPDYDGLNPANVSVINLDYGDEVPAALSIDPPTGDLTVGTNFTVDVVVADVMDLYGVELELTFDPTIVEVVGEQVTPGSCPSPDFIVENIADNTTGTINYAATSLSPSPPCDGGGVIASITFHGLAEGDSPVHFAVYLLADTDLNSIPVDSVQDGSLTVNPEAGITVEPTSGLVTTEAGGTDTFTVVLDSQPTANVSIGLSSSVTSEGTVSPSSLTFTPANWDSTQTVTVTGVDDAILDGDIPYNILTAAAVSSDPNYSGLNPENVSVTNLDDETGTILSIAPPVASLPVSTNFTVDVVVTDVVDLYGVELELTFDPTFVEVVDDDPGTTGIQIQPRDCPTPDFVVENSADNTTGTINYAATSLSPSPPCDGDGVIASITFHGLAVGVSPVHFAVYLLADTDLNSIPVDSSQDGSLNVTPEPGITVEPTSGLVTDEDGGTETFTVVLDSQPSADVSIGLNSSDTSEGTVSPSSLTFTPANWDSAKTVTVTGVDDDLVDGDISYLIVTAPATSADKYYDGLDADDVSVTNLNKTVVGISVTPTSGLVTTEAGGTDTFTVVLKSQPSANVSIGLSSSDTSEGTVSPASLTFTSTNWNTPKTVTVTGVDDTIDDGDISYMIVTAPATSSDSDYNGLNAANVSVTNTDNDGYGITITPPSGLVTTEAGGTDTFTVVLNSQPSADVTLGLSSSDTSEGTVLPSSLTFTSANWHTARTVTITGVDDAVDDGDIAYTIITAPATSADPNYSGLNPVNVSVTNIDDDLAGITISPISGLNTTEAGGTATFTVVLDSQPLANVSIGLSSSDTSEGTVSPTSLTFTSANWDTARTVTITGVDDAVDDGDIAYTIITAPATSADPNYSGLNPANVSVTNIDDDGYGFTITPLSGLVTTEAGGTDTFTVVLNKQPSANVTLGLSSSDTTEGTVSPLSLTFTTANWNTPKTVTVRGVDDAVVDGDIVYLILTASATSADPNYDGKNAVDVSVINIDDDKALTIIYLPLVYNE